MPFPASPTFPSCTPGHAPSATLKSLLGDKKFGSELPKQVSDLLFLTDLMWYTEDCHTDFVPRRLSIPPPAALNSTKGIEEVHQTPLKQAPQLNEAHAVPEGAGVEEGQEAALASAVISKDQLLRRRHTGVRSPADVALPAWRCAERLAGGKAKPAKRRNGLGSTQGSPGLSKAASEGRQELASCPGDFSCSVSSPHTEEQGSDSDGEAPQAEEELDVIVGPTANAVMPKAFEELILPGPERAIRSNPSALYLSDIMVLCQAGRRALSFGSVLHLCMQEEHCRPCMFERKSRKCKKSWLCDFCHLHAEFAHRTLKKVMQSNDSALHSMDSLADEGSRLGFAELPSMLQCSVP